MLQLEHKQAAVLVAPPPCNTGKVIRQLRSLWKNQANASNTRTQGMCWMVPNTRRDTLIFWPPLLQGRTGTFQKLQATTPVPKQSQHSKRRCILRLQLLSYMPHSVTNQKVRCGCSYRQCHMEVGRTLVLSPSTYNNCISSVFVIYV
jgi:hypothetical protein